MAAKPKNPEAFPLTTDYFRGGMSLRDYFAAAVATGIIANPQNRGHIDTVAKLAYEMADAMLIVRERRKPMTEIKNVYGEVIYTSAKVYHTVGHAVHQALKAGVNLQCADLANVDLQYADLGGANFQGVNLMKANLQNANLRCVSLRGADLRGANLIKADLSGADLEGANLLGAKIKIGNKVFTIKEEGTDEKLS
jgi:hypothetical protein